MKGLTTIRLVRGRDGLFPRIKLSCPFGHEVVDAPLDSHLGQRLNEGNYSGESCTHGSCEWSGEARCGSCGKSGPLSPLWGFCDKCQKAGTGE